MAQHNKLGNKGEDIAARYLAAKGYKILERNWRHERDEIDIIALDGVFLVIAEVKTRSTAFFGEPEEAVNRKKQKYLVRAADAYIQKNNIMLETRYDILSVIIDGNTETVRHIEDAFYPTL